MASIRWSYGVVFFDAAARETAASHGEPLRSTVPGYPLPNLELDLNLSGTALPVRSGAPAGLQTRAAARPTAARPTALWQGSWTPRRMRSAASLWAVLETISSTRRKTRTRRHACVLLS